MKKHLTAVDEIPNLLKDLYKIVGRLEKLFPGRPFTLDGHLVGSIGEVLAAKRYGLELLPPGFEGHDARDTSGRLVQIKATQRARVGLTVEPERLIVLKILSDGTDVEVYNGLGSGPWKHAGKMQKNGQRVISVKKLESLMQNQGPGN